MTEGTWRQLTAGLARAWRRVLGDEEEHVRRHKRVAHGFADQHLHIGLDEMLAQEAGRYYTTVHVVSLSGFRRAVGDNWPKLADKVLMIAESVVHRHVGNDGAYGRRGEDMILMVFSNLPQAEARRRVHAAGKEIGERLMGSARFTAEDLVDCVELDAAEAVVGGAVDLSMAAAAVDEARRAAPPPDQPQQQPLQRHLQAGAAPPPPEPPRQFHGTKPADVVADAVADLRPEQKARHRISFLPTWIAQGEAIAACLVRLHRQDLEDGPVLVGSAAYDRPDVALALDRMVARAVTPLLAHPDPAAAKTVLIVPVNFAALVSRHRLLLTGIYAELPEALRLLRLEFEVFGIPDDPSAQQLLDAVAALEPLAHDVMMRLPPHHLIGRLAADCGFHGIGFHAADLASPEHLPKALEAAKRRADDAGLAAHVWGLPTRQAVQTAASLGYARFNGRGLARSVPRPAPPAPLPLARLLDAHLLDE